MKSIQQPSAEQLRIVIQDMDAQAQWALDRIVGLCSVALIALETPRGRRSTENIAQVFESIRAIAEDSGSAVSNFAAEVVYPYTDPASLRRAGLSDESRR